MSSYHRIFMSTFECLTFLRWRELVINRTPILSCIKENSKQTFTRLLLFDYEVKDTTINQSSPQTKYNKYRIINFKLSGILMSYPFQLFSMWNNMNNSTFSIPHNMLWLFHTDCTPRECPTGQLYNEKTCVCVPGML